MNEEIDLCGQGTQASLNVPVRREGGRGGGERRERERSNILEDMTT